MIVMKEGEFINVLNINQYFYAVPVKAMGVEELRNKITNMRSTSIAYENVKITGYLEQGAASLYRNHEEYPVEDILQMTSGSIARMSDKLYRQLGILPGYPPMPF